MLQIAIFVDAGYLYAQGSVLIAGHRQDRRVVRLDVPAAVADLIAEAAVLEPKARLLRVYWYDGLTRGAGLSLEQKTVARSENVKCRFGTINTRGEQKEVDSLIVTDLVELARTKAISDALILSGDGDLRIGVQIAQAFGIRVHLLGIHPARGSQSPELIDEADTTREWGREKVSTWLSVIQPEPSPGVQDPDQATTAGVAKLLAGSDVQLIHEVVESRTALLEATALRGVLEYVQANRNQLPPDFDRPALGAARLKLQRDLSDDERRDFRRALVEALRRKLSEHG